MFSDATGAELLLMYSAYDPKNAVILVSRLMVLVCVIFSTPLLHYPVSYLPCDKLSLALEGKIVLLKLRHHKI